MGRKSLAKERREQIVRALNRCVAEYGLQKTTIKNIARKAGVQPGILHHYFKDRDEIIEEMVEMIVNEVSAKYLEELQRHDDPEKRFEEGIDFLFNPVMINDEYASFFYDCWAEAKRNPRIRESFKMLYTRFRKAIIDLLAQNKGAAGLSSAKIQELADMIMAIQDGISLQWEMLPNGVSLKKAASMTKQMIRLYIREENRSR
ncbi:MAG: TetR family transcriptional regulator [Candidatus Abyssobacteria bacterium SURF_5]|uniref:TetR family transcriptional regulator n=1 Tax=Abyssobacteria bacterium (strain SURF_5) TaxID=2093360 RepID=A0A3A4ND93_ABYX5|nr:MAG: TetR family transcriptional regulator [Candidatus Abyssubacteria bacterium SURF_5]